MMESLNPFDDPQQRRCCATYNNNTVCGRISAPFRPSGRSSSARRRATRAPSGWNSIGKTFCRSQHARRDRRRNHGSNKQCHTPLTLSAARRLRANGRWSRRNPASGSPIKFPRIAMPTRWPTPSNSTAPSPWNSCCRPSSGLGRGGHAAPAFCGTRRRAGAMVG